MMMEAIGELFWYAFGGPVERIVVKEDPDNIIEALNAWFVANGGSGARVERAPDARCGLFATETLEAGDVYLHVPRKLLITRDERTYERARRLFPPDLAHAVALCVALLSQKTPYFRALPRDFSHHPLMWEKFEGLGLAEARRTMRLFVAACRIARDPALPLLSRRDYAWAYLVWLTRCIFTGKEWCFVPMVDFTNCRWSPHVPFSKTVIEGDYAVIRTPVPLSPGAEVFENYGWTNYDYLKAHGFLTDIPDDALVLEPRRLRGRYAQTLGTTWAPRLFKKKAFISETTAFDSEEWARVRNHSFIVAVAISLDKTDLECSIADAPPRVVRAAWLYLSELATSAKKDLEENLRKVAEHPRPPGHDWRPILRRFYTLQLDLATSLAPHYESLAAPPPAYDA